jgi:hypothetical protein
MFARTSTTCVSLKYLKKIVVVMIKNKKNGCHHATKHTNPRKLSLYIWSKKVSRSAYEESEAKTAAIDVQ